MKALFIGHFVTDINVRVPNLPKENEKIAMTERKSSFGGNAVTAAFACAKLNVNTHLITQVADDSKAAFERKVADEFGVTLHPCSVQRSSENFVFIVEGSNNDRRIIKAPETPEFRKTSNVPALDVSEYGILHVDCTMGGTALDYTQAARSCGVTTSLDGSHYNNHVDELLNHIDVAVVSEDFMAHFYSLDETFDYLKNKGVKVGAVTIGNKGTRFFDIDAGTNDQHIPAYDIKNVESTNGAGDIFHGAYVSSFANNPNKSWAEHFEFATAASAHSVQYFTNMESCPTQEDVAQVQKHLKQS